LLTVGIIPVAKYFEIVYINTYDDRNADLPDAALRIRDWSWGTSALVRWSYVEAGDRAPLSTADLAILDWSSRNSSIAKRVCGRIRDDRPELPVLIFKSDAGRAPSRDMFLAKDIHTRFLSDHNIETAQAISDTFTNIDLKIMPPNLELHAQEDWGTSTFVKWIGRERLVLALQKYFPDASDAYLISVGGGWSDARLCRVFIDQEPDEYFVKFFTDRDVFTSELLQHAAAAQWLGSATVELRLIPDIKGDITAQNEAFPDVSPSRYPACYRSASTRARPRETLKGLYRDQPDEFIEGATLRLINILGTDQPLYESNEPPWADSPKVGFKLQEQTKVNILETIHDLSMYGPRIYGEAQWNSIQRTIQEFLYRDLPKKLFEPWFVILGHTHGDPNPRNCLVSANDRNDILLIDCGEYRKRGRLVSDLALLERDVKLVLMATELSASQFLDLDITKLADWSYSERESLAQALACSPKSAPGSSTVAKRAFRLVGHLRERAQTLAADKDIDGRHYFGALLFWTLDGLKYTAIRPTKKLFALYSAAEIINLLR
jgi:hypothetical protein